MPRHIDRAQRELDLTNAAIRILSTKGPRALTLRGLATELGGSQTLVTHFYPRRSSIFEAVVDRLIAAYDEMFSKFELGDDPIDDLRALLEWMLPMDEQDMLSELGRVLLVGHLDEDPSIQHFFDAMELKMRDLLRRHLEPLLDPSDVDDYVDLMRVMVNGVVLSSVEHPTTWTEARQRRLLSRLIAMLPVTTTS